MAMYCFDSRLRQVLFHQHLHITYLRYRGYRHPGLRTSLPRTRLCFEKYSVLGDNGVNADQNFAEKSLISSIGCAEFARRFRVRGLTRDLSLVFFRSLPNSYNPFGLIAVHHKHPGCRVTTLARVGAGYKALARFYQSRSYHGMVPVMNHNWKVTRSDPSLLRFGLFWRIYDLVALKGIGFMPPILEPLSRSLVDYPYIQGGFLGTK
ncbi:hypothetical protein M9H77_17163 [Catharanthus roseus]|uniref:Uncharacterized protein n=1 Tax=Catharanthus roseus TaxID=4058 RepID=A0ACC0B3S0_CATRO|nr:hypothetical protein M9H77_17163 [Catharanthus roseus]